MDNNQKLIELEQRYDNKEITAKEFHNEGMKLLGNKRGFFQKLDIKIDGLASNNISPRVREWFKSDRYFKRLQDKTDEVLEKTNWVSFWQRQDWLKAPSNEDHETLPYMNDEALANIWICLCQSLKQLIANDFEESETALNLNKYFKLLRDEINNRPSMFKIPDKDYFAIDVANKTKNQKKAKEIENARKTGALCIRCHSRKIISYNKQEWKCKSCGKRFRKR